MLSLLGWNAIGNSRRLWPARYIRVRTRWRWHDIVDDHSRCQISSASRKFFKNGVEYFDFFACRIRPGYVNVAARVATNVKTSIVCLMVPLISRFTDSVTYVREYDATKNVSRILSRIVMSQFLYASLYDHRDNFYTVTVAPLIDGE